MATTLMDYEHNKLYFYPISEKIHDKQQLGCWIYAIIFIGFFTLTSSLGVKVIFAAIIIAIIGLAMIAGSIGYIKHVKKRNKKNAEECEEFNRNRKIVKGKELDIACINYLSSNLKNMALKKLGIDESEAQEIAPIYFSGYDYDTNSDFKQGKESFVCEKDKDDNIWRSSIYNAVMFFFSSEQVYCYKLRFSLLEDVKTENTQEYFYRDIVSVSTSSEGVKRKSGETINIEQFTLVTPGGTSMGASIFDTDDTTEHSIKDMKNLLRSKKLQS